MYVFSFPTSIIKAGQQKEGRNVCWVRQCFASHGHAKQNYGVNFFCRHWQDTVGTHLKTLQEGWAALLQFIYRNKMLHIFIFIFTNIPCLEQRLEQSYTGTSVCWTNEVMWCKYPYHHSLQLFSAYFVRHYRIILSDYTIGYFIHTI